MPRLLALIAAAILLLLVSVISATCSEPAAHVWNAENACLEVWRYAETPEGRMPALAACYATPEEWAAAEDLKIRRATRLFERARRHAEKEAVRKKAAEAAEARARAIHATNHHNANTMGTILTVTVLTLIVGGLLAYRFAGRAATDTYVFPEDHPCAGGVPWEHLSSEVQDQINTAEDLDIHTFVDEYGGCYRIYRATVCGEPLKVFRDMTA